MGLFLAPSDLFLTSISIVDTSRLSLSLSTNNIFKYSPSNTATVVNRNLKLVYSQSLIENSPND